MKLSAKNQYAFKSALELALRYRAEQKPVQLAAISRAQQIPKKFLVQILLKLKDAGVVQTSRGAAGGYYLARHPSKVKLTDVLKAVDNNILEAHRFSPKSESDRLIGSLWEDVNSGLISRLDITLEELVFQLQGLQLNYQI